MSQHTLRGARAAFAIALTSLSLPSLSLPAQSPSELFSVRRAESFGRFGWQVCVPGDLDGDELDDFVVGSHDADVVRAYSGRTGRQLFELFGQPGDAFGYSIEAAGDVDADGTDDFVIGAPQFPLGLSAPGYVVVVSGRTGSPLRTIAAQAGGLRFGEHVAGAGDFNSDGFDDIVASWHANGGNNAIVHSGRDGAVLFNTGRGDPIHSVAGVDDLDRDGFDDIAIGQGDAVSVYSGRTRTHLTAIPSPTGAIAFGDRIAAGDLDGDGSLEIVIADAAAVVARHPGSVFAYSFPTGNLVMQLNGASPGDHLGSSLRVVDVTGDGQAEMVIGVPGADPSAGFVQAVAFDGTLTGKVVAIVTGNFGGEQFGVSHDTGDLDGDGLPDFVVGADHAAELAPMAGRVTAFVNNFTADPGRVFRHGAGCDDSFGRRAAISIRGRPVLGETFSLTARAAPFSSPSFLALGAQRANLPLGVIGMPGCGSHVSLLVILPSSTSASGTCSVQIQVPNAPSLTGGLIQAQWLLVDPPANQLGMVASGGLELRVGAG